MEADKIPGTEAEREGYPAIMRLVPMPSPQEREERLLRSLARNPELSELYARNSNGCRESGGPRPFWPV